MRLFLLCCFVLIPWISAHADEATGRLDPGATPVQLVRPAEPTAPPPLAWINQALGREPSPSMLIVPAQPPNFLLVQPGHQAAPAASSLNPAGQSGKNSEQRARKPERAKSISRSGKPAASHKPVQPAPPPLLASSQQSPPSPVGGWRDFFSMARIAAPAQTAITPLLPSAQPVPSKTNEPPEEEAEAQVKIESVLTKKLRKEQAPTEMEPSDTEEMLVALVELQKNLRQQIVAINKRLKASTSEAEKASLQEMLIQLDLQLSESVADFERIATGVEPAIFTDQKQETFSWKDELTALLQPSIKELKQLTARARQKTELKDAINQLGRQAATASQAVEHLNAQIEAASNPRIKTYLRELLPAWQNMDKRIQGKLDIAQRELAKLEADNGNVAESASLYMKDFFRERGLYLLLACVAFAVALLFFRVLHRLLFSILPGARKEQRPFYARVLHIALRILSVTAAFASFVFVLYTAEDWLLLSLAIIILAGVAWTVRQTVPKLWQQARLVLNLGSVREGERVMYNGLPWKVESLNVFCKLSNPALAMFLQVPVEDMIGLVSRPYALDEPWFPCKKDDWVAIDGKPLAKVVSLSPEQVEVVEMGGRRIVYQTADFLAAQPANLSRNFNLKVVFGLSYDLQAEITTIVPERIKAFLERKLEEHGHAEHCLNLAVDFLQAGPSSLDLAVLADFKGEAAPAYRRIERALNRWCVECCNQYGWEIPFPQMTLRRPASGKP